MFDKIITVTLNPSLDTTIWLNEYDFGEPVEAECEKIFAGSKSINVSRVLVKLGIKNKCIGILGEDNAQKMKLLLDDDNVNYDFIQEKGAIRENLLIVLPDKKMLRINRKGFKGSLNAFLKIEEMLEREICDINGECLIVFAGSLPDNISKEQYKELLDKFNRENIAICIDTDMFTADEIKAIRPFIIKPNRVELSHMANKNFENLNEIKKYAKELSKYVEHVIVSVDSDGIIYAGTECCLSCKPPQVEVTSTVGAGDTALAGFISQLVLGKSITECIQFATACATQSVTIEGTGLIEKNDVKNIFSLIEIGQF